MIIFLPTSKKIISDGLLGKSRSRGRNLGQEVKYNLTFHLDDDNLLHPNFYNGLDELVKDEIQCIFSHKIVVTNNGGIGITHPLELEIVFTKKKQI